MRFLPIETDERAHADRNQEDEKRRYNEFTSNFPHKFVFIRFNPNTNMEEKLAETDFKHKLGVLMRSIKSQIQILIQNLCGHQLIYVCIVERDKNSQSNTNPVTPHAKDHPPPLAIHACCILDDLNVGLRNLP